jgi:hypothetical protein
MWLAKAIRLAIKGWHLQRFTAQMLAADAFRATALEGYERAEGLLERAATASERLRRKTERQVSRTIRRLRRRYRRLRPEFRQGLLPDRRAIESALRALVREVSSRELVKHWIPRFETSFSSSTLLQAIETDGYEPFGYSTSMMQTSIVSLVPSVADGRLRRCLECFFRELGVRVMTTNEQLANLGHDRLEQIHSLAEAPERLRSYLHAIGQRIDTLVVPVSGELGELGNKVQILAATAVDRASRVPRLACLCLEGSRRDEGLLTVEIEDRGSRLQLVELRISEDGAWQPIEPVDGVTDGPEEKYEIGLEPDAVAVWIRVSDVAGNQAVFSPRLD